MDRKAKAELLVAAALVHLARTDVSANVASSSKLWDQGPLPLHDDLGGCVGWACASGFRMEARDVPFFRAALALGEDFSKIELLSAGVQFLSLRAACLCWSVALSSEGLVAVGTLQIDAHTGHDLWHWRHLFANSFCQRKWLVGVSRTRHPR